MISPSTSEPSGFPSLRGDNLASSASHVSPQTRDPKPQTLPLRLAQWHTHEPPRSRRTEEAVDRICVPTSPDSLGYRLVCAEPDGPALWCAWTLLVGIAGRHARPLRGFLVHDSGRPCTAADLGLMTGFPAALFERALAFFSDPHLGWLVPAEADAVSVALQEIAETRAARATFEKERDAASRAHREARRRHRARERLAEKLVADPAERPAFIARLIAEEQNALGSASDSRDFWAALAIPDAAPPSDAPLSNPSPATPSPAPNTPSHSSHYSPSSLYPPPPPLQSPNSGLRPDIQPRAFDRPRARSA